MLFVGGFLWGAVPVVQKGVLPNGALGICRGSAYLGSFEGVYSAVLRRPCDKTLGNNFQIGSGISQFLL